MCVCTYVPLFSLGLESLVLLLQLVADGIHCFFRRRRGIGGVGVYPALLHCARRGSICVWGVCAFNDETRAGEGGRGWSDRGEVLSHYLYDAGVYYIDYIQYTRCGAGRQRAKDTTRAPHIWEPKNNTTGMYVCTCPYFKKHFNCQSSRYLQTSHFFVSFLFCSLLVHPPQNPCGRVSFFGETRLNGR